MILDTSFVIDVLTGDPATEDVEERIAGRGDAYLTPVTVMELWEGVRRAGSEEEQAAVLQFLEDFASFPFDRAAALTAGEISADLAGDGQMIDAEDIMVGAIALEHGETVVTADADHVQRISGLDVETY